MRGATAYIKWETSHELKLNDIEPKALTTTEIEDDSFFLLKFQFLQAHTRLHKAHPRLSTPEPSTLR